METFNIFPLNHSPILQLSYALLIISTIPFALSEIRNSHIIDDSRGVIDFHEFGFSQHGQAFISIKDISWKSKNHTAKLNASSMGFVLLNDSSFLPLFEEYNCILSSPRFVKVLFTFEKLTRNSSTYNVSIAIDEPGQIGLIFGNCQPEFEVSMDVHTEMYNVRHGEKDFLPVGQTKLPMIFFLLFLTYTVFFIIWVFICIKQRAIVERIHIIMGALLLFKTLNMICAFQDKIYVRKTGAPPLGWDVAYYLSGLFKGIILFTVIVLIGTGWSFLKPYLQEREKKVLMVVIPLQILENIAYVVLEETSLASTTWLSIWHIIFFLVDMMCCLAVFLPILWSISSLEEASKTEGKAARTLEKLTLFRRFYMVIVTYMYFTRCIVLVNDMGDYQFEWVTNASVEGANLAFYVFLFYNFKPIKRNPYLVIDEEEENDARKLLETDRW